MELVYIKQVNLILKFEIAIVKFDNKDPSGTMFEYLARGIGSADEGI